MPKDKDRALNPAAAQHKAEKQRLVKKNKAAVTAQRNERLAHRNPDRLQRQIDELKSLESSQGQLSQRDKTNLADLERDVARIRKAKDAVGDKSGTVQRDGHDRGRNDGRPGQVLGKRGRSPHQRRFNQHGSRNSSSSATDEGVGDIPMPRDTPPPIPSRRRKQHDRRDFQEPGPRGGPHPLPERPGATVVPAPAIAQQTYESKPVLRDLRREAASFVPSAVKRKLDVAKGGVDQPLMEEEELEKLEKEGYMPGSSKAAAGATDTNAIRAEIEDEMSRFNSDVKRVQIEEVADEDA